MDIKLTEIVRATTISLKVSDAPSGMANILSRHFVAICDAVADLWDQDEPGDFFTAQGPTVDEINARGKKHEFVAGWVKVDPVPTFEVGEKVHVAGLGDVVIKDVHRLAEEPVKRRGRPPKKQEPNAETVEAIKAAQAGEVTRVESVSALVTELNTPEPTPLEQAIRESLEGQVDTAKTDDAIAEDKEPQGESSELGETTNTPTPSSSTPTSPDLSPVTDRDLQSYCVKVAQHYGGAAKVYDLCKPYVGEGAVARPSNIKGDDLRWQFIRAVEADSGVKYHG